MSIKKKLRGFTLIEIMIVVIIMAILATLILPKMLAAPEAAYLSEANETLGALARAQDTYMQLTGSSTVGLGIASNNSATWARLGMSMPSGSKFTYSCSTNACSATRTVSGGATGTATLDYTTHTWSCDGTTYHIAGTSDRGCVVM